MKAVRLNGLNLQHASEALRGDEEVVLASVRCDLRDVFCFASEELR